MYQIKGPETFLAQFLDASHLINSLSAVGAWASGLDFKGVQIPAWDTRVIDLDLASSLRTYWDEISGKLADQNLEIIELEAYVQGQCMAMHLAYEKPFRPFYPSGLNGTEHSAWSTDQLKIIIDAPVLLGTKNFSVLTATLSWAYHYLWHQQTEGLIEDAFTELGKRWLPVLDHARENGITIGFELHPGSDLFDRYTYQSFLEMVNGHEAACITYDPSPFLLQQADYIEFIHLFSDRIRAYHVKDAEFKPTGLSRLYGGYADRKNRAGRFRSLCDGQVDFKMIFGLLTKKGYDGWVILEWKYCIKGPEQGVRESVPFIKALLIETTTKTFDHFIKGENGRPFNRELPGLNLNN